MDKRTEILEFYSKFKLNKNSYNIRANDLGKRDPGPRFFSENLDILLILLTILVLNLLVGLIMQVQRVQRVVLKYLLMAYLQY